jgi:hypothetical protein
VSGPIPVVLFAYARPRTLARVLACLRENAVPLIEAFADGAKGAADAPAVAEVRAMLRVVDWCEVRLTERKENFGLGKNVLAGVSAVAARHEALVVWEDDLVCVPGTYAWMCAALRHYAKDERVMSVTGWTHPDLSGKANGPYFDERAEGWVWGTYARAWEGMDESSDAKIRACRERGVRPFRYGPDIALMLRNEVRRKLWAVRWVLHHFQHGGRCLRPPVSLIEHIGNDGHGSNAAADAAWSNPRLGVATVPTRWPEVTVQPELAARWFEAVWRRLPWRQRAVWALCHGLRGR